MSLIIFDLDGTLFRTETIEVKAVNRAFAAIGLKEGTREEILDCMGLTMPEFCKRWGITDKEAARKYSEDVLVFEKEELKNGELYDGVEGFLKRLREKGHTLCICSNGQIEYVKNITGHFGIQNLFDELWGHKEGYTKSAAVGCLAEKYGSSGFIMVGDRTSDVEAGRDNGCITIGAAYGYGGKEAYAADYTAESIADLERIIDQINN